MPPQRTTPTARAVKTERTHEENQERAYIAASRRSDRSIEARVESARRASDIHKKRTGRALRVTEQDVINEDMYEEEDDDLPRQLRNMTAHLQTGSHDFNARLANYLIAHFGGPQAAQDFIKSTADTQPPQAAMQSALQAARSLCQPSPDQNSFGVQNQMARHAAMMFGHSMPQQFSAPNTMGYMNSMQQQMQHPQMQQGQMQQGQMQQYGPSQMQMRQYCQPQQQPQFTMTGNALNPQQQQQQHNVQSMRLNSGMPMSLPIRGTVTSPVNSSTSSNTAHSPVVLTPQQAASIGSRTHSASSTSPPLPSIEQSATPQPRMSTPQNQGLPTPDPSSAATMVNGSKRQFNNMPQQDLTAAALNMPQYQYSPNTFNAFATETPSQQEAGYDHGFFASEFVANEDPLHDMFKMGGPEAPWDTDLHNSYAIGSDNYFKAGEQTSGAAVEPGQLDLRTATEGGNEYMNEWTNEGDYDNSQGGAR